MADSNASSSPGPKPDNTYRLAIFDAPDDPKAVRDLLSGVIGDHPTDAAQWVARTPGIWARPLAEGEVRELLDGLYDLGVAAEAWRIDAIPNLFPPKSVHEAACLAEGLRIHGLRGEPIHWVPWEKVELINAGRVAQEDEFRETPPDWSSALFQGVRALSKRPGKLSPRASRVPRDPVGEIHLVRKDPRICLRIVESRMNYGYLGDRLKPSASENFPILLADLKDRATAAYLTTPARALLTGDDPETFTFETPAAMLEDTTLKLLWSWYRRDRDSGLRTME